MFVIFIIRLTGHVTIFCQNSGEISQTLQTCKWFFCLSSLVGEQSYIVEIMEITFFAEQCLWEGRDWMEAIHLYLLAMLSCVNLCVCQLGIFGFCKKLLVYILKFIWMPFPTFGNLFLYYFLLLSFVMLSSKLQHQVSLILAIDMMFFHK